MALVYGSIKTVPLFIPPASERREHKSLHHLDTAINWCRMVIKGCKGTPALFRATSYEVFHVEVQLIAQVRMRLFFFNNQIREIGKWRGSVSQFQVRVLRKDPARKRKLESGGVQ